MRNLNKNQILRLKRLIKKTFSIREITLKLNEAKVNWGLAAGIAFFIYFGGENKEMEDVDIWVSEKDKEKVGNLFGQIWRHQLSERHRAENFEFGVFDFFTHCQKYKDGKQLLNYRWTDTVTKNLRKVKIDGIEYRIISPEDIAILKIPNPRNQKELNQINKIMAEGIDQQYFNQRLKECNAQNLI